MDEFASPLHWAIQEGFTLIAEVLIANGVDTNQLDSNQRSPLDLALEKNYLHVVKALVENQADVKQQIFFRLNHFIFNISYP